MQLPCNTGFGLEENNKETRREIVLSGTEEMHRRRVFVQATALCGISALAAYQYVRSKQRKGLENWHNALKESQNAIDFQPPPRFQMLNELKQQREPLDILIIGGGATGAGCALDAAVRGLRVACVERGDFASETSSKSTKLVHGGVRYLEKAIKNLDWSQYKLVREALRERATFLQIAPHLSNEFSIALPIYSWYKVPYFWCGSKIYDFIAGNCKLSPSFFLTKQQTLKEFPLLNDKGLCGAMIYSDGQQNDARMNLALAQTATYYKAKVLNYTEVTKFLKSPEGKINGVEVQDRITNDKFNIYAKCIINATGPFSDVIKQLDDPQSAPLMCASSGTHIVLPAKYSSTKMGFIDPRSHDGRVIFMLPWQGRLIVGTTDEPASVRSNPLPTQKEIDFILSQVNKNLSKGNSVGPQNVLSSWSGIRPLVSNPSVAHTAALVRSHFVEMSKSGLVSITGGKWTTYRHMAEDTVDFCIKHHQLMPNITFKSTMLIPLLGSHGYRKELVEELAAKYSYSHELTDHLVHTYGDRAERVLQLAKENNQHNLLAPGFPCIEAEVTYAIRNEYAMKLTDIIARRLRLSFLDVLACNKALPRISQIMGREMGWTKDKVEKEQKEAVDFLSSMGLDFVSKWNKES